MNEEDRCGAGRRPPSTIEEEGTPNQERHRGIRWLEALQQSRKLLESLGAGPWIDPSGNCLGPREED